MATMSFQASGRSESTIQIDESDWAEISQFKWYTVKRKGSHTRYAQTSINGRLITMHRFLMEAGKGDEIDHIDGNGLNNTRANLRFATHSQNIKAAWRLPGRYGNLTIEELDRELEEFIASQEP